MKITCQKCKYEWEYNGEKKPNNNYSVWIACPRCRSNIKLEQEEKNGK